MTFPRCGSRRAGRGGIPSIRLRVVPGMVPLMRGLQWGLAGIVVSMGCLTGWMWWERGSHESDAAQYAVATERTDSFNQRLTVQLAQEQLTLSAQQVGAIQEEVQFINQLAEKRGFSWTQLLHDLEDALPVGTAIGKIQRDAAHSRLTITGRATEMSALNGLMSTLQSHSAFRLPVLHQHRSIDSRHSEGDEGRGASGIEFSLTVQYRGLTDKDEAHDGS